MISFVDTALMAFAALRANPLRSFLTLLGVVIASATIVAMMSLTEGLRREVSSDLEGLGTGVFQVQRFPAIMLGPTDWAKYSKRQPLTREDGEALERLCPHVSHVSIEEYGWERVKIATRDRSTKPEILLVGAVPAYAFANAVNIAEGRFLSGVDMDLGRRVVVIGSDVADILFPGEEALGKDVRIRARPFRVIGVLERLGSTLGFSRDAVAIVPLPAYEATEGKIDDVHLAIRAASPDQIDEARDEVIAQLRRLRGVPPGEENDFEIFSNESIQKIFSGIIAAIVAATLGICALSLLVGGIGIMNIMLVSVAERTGEVGIRKALGARRRRILSQFVVEAMVLSLVGGVLGAILGGAGAIVARETLQIPAAIPAWAVALALALAAVTGLVFGIYPAARASELDPVQAMRAD